MVVELYLPNKNAKDKYRKVKNFPEKVKRRFGVL